MPDVPVDPPHIRQAKAALAAAGIPAEAGLAALDLARDFYQASPQVNRAEVLRQERNRTQEELERVSEDLLWERKKSKLQAQQLAQLGAMPVPKGVLKALLNRLRAIRDVLLHGTWSDARKVETARELLDKALVSLATHEELRDEHDAPLIIIQTQLVRVERAKHSSPAPAGTVPLVGGQRHRLAELEDLLGRRSRFEKQLDRLLTQLHCLITTPEDELRAATVENELLRRFLRKWGSMVGMLENLLVMREQQ